MTITVLQEVRVDRCPTLRRVPRAHAIVEAAGHELDLNGQPGSGVSFLAMAAAVHLAALLGPAAGRAAMQRAIDYACPPEGR
ncbi:hypothetical protein E4M02_02500 [Brevundimonas sp. S30B]|uniref:hypothetical protein n=1 Tax=unclassified Brevundimonas TaxID=2622653 RepID=UPI001071C179|nr:MULTISPECIES: hypothetical protein [unclassified Brevundimonas]QBX37239.1 hypothetical protein E4M01_05320 [Brevundimonas sp. MF30-B]TFW03968.1 hypothetical protein E4M02_02500 [Brevundimonas sp. S30B]